jgi:hypothetical protein
LVKTTDPGWIMRWFGPAALNAMCVPSDALDFRTSASHKLARAAEFVPACVPVTTLLLGESTSGALMDLVRRGPYDVVVVTDALLGRSRRLRCELKREDVRIVLVPCRPTPAADIPAGDADGPRAKARA